MLSVDEKTTLRGSLLLLLCRSWYNILVLRIKIFKGGDWAMALKLRDVLKRWLS
jgi:hypothetical protein